MDCAAQTERIIRAVSNPYTTILGHMTGRQLLRRPGYDIDIEKVLAACAQHGVAVGINANPWRLDLDWRWHETRQLLRGQPATDMVVRENSYAGETAMPVRKAESAMPRRRSAEVADYIHTQLMDLAVFAQQSELDSVARLIMAAALEAQLQWAFRRPRLH
jgi:hypothetical protein